MNRTVSVRAFTRVAISTQSCSDLCIGHPVSSPGQWRKVHASETLSNEGRAIVKSKEGLRGC